MGVILFFGDSFFVDDLWYVHQIIHSVLMAYFPDICLLGPGSPISKPFGGVLPSKDKCADLVFCLCPFAICFVFCFFNIRNLLIFIFNIGPS